MLRRAGGPCTRRGTKTSSFNCRRWVTRWGVIPFVAHRCLIFNGLYEPYSQLSFYRWNHTTTEYNLSNDAATEDDDTSTLEDYEELLLHSEASETAKEGFQSCGLNDDDTHHKCQQSDLSSSAMRLVNEILDLLPADGSGLRLTSITPALDAEAVSELYGSVLAFLQLFPHRFRCCQIEESDGSLRWFVSRAQSERKASLLLSQEEPKYVCGDDKCAAKPTVGLVRVKLHSAQEALVETARRTILEEFQEFLPENEPAATAGLLHTLPTELQESIRRSGGGLLRLLKNPTAQDFVDLSMDTTLVGVKGLLSSRGMPTYHQQIVRATDQDTIPITPAPDYAEDVWDVELDLDDNNNDTVLSNECNDTGDAVEPDEDFFRGDSSATATVSSGTSQLPRTVIPPAPPKPPERSERRKTPPPLSQKSKEYPSSQGRISPEDLLKAHTEVALLRGRRSPSEMLDLFVECVPSFYVPVHQVKVTDALARVLGPQNTLHKVIKIYSYYFDRDKSTDTVRLKPTLIHPRLGMANAFFEDGGNKSSASDVSRRKLQETDLTRVFPVLQAPLRMKVDSFTTKKKDPTGRGSVDATPACGAPSSETFALLEALSHDQYVDISQWAHTAGVSVSSLEPFARNASQHHYFLTRPNRGGQEETLLWRLRPYWLAPGCIGELGADDSCEAAAVARHLKPIWLSINRLLEKLSPSEHKAVLEVARQYDGVGPWLRRHGRFCWVDKNEEKARMYRATAELDDHVHVAVLYLQNSLPVEYVKLEDVVQSCTTSSRHLNKNNNNQATGIRNLLAHGLTVSNGRDVSSAHPTVGLMEQGKMMQEDVHLFLSRHKQHLKVKQDGGVLWVARRSMFFRSSS
ncbi:hypothetical protein DQ04_08071000 [Trypanosoma grayi]|uniref:hypothetical protein n=1 Tax=Trypanosoma grayi TaxID=71804 RepID=UPI0004F4B708|nr:hypothetical protein DQ04_08071000 [Trypanosoma grayi]KEG08071.1 hypothetical protein DQ04_08071000 [Trypanosoma grayi]